MKPNHCDWPMAGLYGALKQLSESPFYSSLPKPLHPVRWQAPPPPPVLKALPIPLAVIAPPAPKPPAPPPVVAAPAPAPAPPPKKEPEKKEPEKKEPAKQKGKPKLTAIGIKCSHRGLQKDAPFFDVLSRVELADELEAVPSFLDEEGDVEWSAAGTGVHEKKTGKQFKFKINQWLADGFWLLKTKPHTYDLTAKGPDGGQKKLKINLYPANQLEVTVEREKGGNWSTEIKTKPKEQSFKIKNEIIDAFIDKKTQMDYVLDTLLKPWLGDKLKFEVVPAVSLGATLGWEEHTDHRAFFKYEAELKLVLLKASFKIPFSPTAAIPDWLKKWTNLVGDFYLYIEFHGSIEVAGKWGRTEPEKHEVEATGTGKLGAKVGGSLFLMNKQAVNIDVSGGSGFTLAVSPMAEEQVALKFEVAWDGLTIEVTLEAAWGTVEYKRSWQPIPARPLFKEPRVWKLTG